jgi:hypothetical protein
LEDRLILRSFLENADLARPRGIALFGGGFIRPARNGSATYLRAFSDMA